MNNEYKSLEDLVLTEPESIKRLSKQGSKLALSLLPENDVEVVRLAVLVQKTLDLKYSSTQYSRKLIATFDYMCKHFHFITHNSMFEDWCNNLRVYPSSYK